MPKTFVKPLIYDEAHQEHLPASEGQYVDKAFIPVDESVPNALSVTDEGLRVTADALVSEDPDNQLKAQDGKFYVAPATTPQQDVANLVADIDDNQIQIQGDKLYVAPVKAPEVTAADLVSNAEDNQLKVNDNRLYVAPVEVPDPTPGELVSADEGNLLGVGLDGKLAVKADNLPKQSVVSADEGNIVREGTDGGAFVDGNDLLSNGDINLLTISEVDHKIILRKKDVLANLTVVSDDPGNLIGTGSDGGVYMSKDELISEDDDVLTTDSHGKLVTELEMDYNTTTGELRLLGVDGAEVGHAIVPTSTSALRSVEFTRSMPSADGEDVEGDYFVTFAFKFNSQDSWDGGDGVKFTTVKGTPAVQNVDYEMQSTVGTGVFPDHVKAVFMGQMVEQDIEAGTPNTIDFPDGSRLILTWNSSTGTSINFQASFTPGIGIELGSFLRMAWLLADGSVQDVYLEMTDIYSAGNGISIDDTGLVSVVVSSTGGLQNGPDGVGVKVDPDGGLQTSEEGTSIKVDADGGLQTTEDGTSIKIDSTGGLQTNENGTSIKVDPEGGLQTGEAGTSIKTDPASGLVTGPDGTGIDDTWLDNQVTDQIRNTELVTAGNGIQVDTTETGKKVSVVGSDSINSTEAGIAVDEEWLAQEITDKVKGDTSLVTADDSINVTPTGTGVQVGVDTGWLDQQITDQIKNDETLLVKGNGITLTATATGREIAADAGTGVTVDTNGINVDQTWLNNRITDKVKGDATLITGGDGIDTTLTATGTQVSVNDEWLADQITEQVRTDTGLIQAGNGIAINVTDDGKTISANAGTGIVADTDGISVNEEWLATQITDKVIEDTSLVTAGNGVNVTPTGTGVQVAVVGSDSIDSTAGSVAVNEEWLAGKVTEQVRTDANLVVAGNGLTETVGKNGKTLNVNPGAGISVTGDAVTVDTNWLSEQLDTRVESGGFVTAGDGIDVTASDGKAEIAVDDTVVRTSGNQTIDGTKTFNDNIFMDGAGSQGVYKIFPGVTKGTAPAATVYTSLLGLDKDGNTGPHDQTKRLVMLEMGVTPTQTLANLYAYKNEADVTTRAELGVCFPNGGASYAYAPSTPAAASSNEIVTVDYLKGANSGVVHTTREEIIAGRKIFESDVFLRQAGSCDVYSVNTAVTKGTPPAENEGAVSRLILSDKTGLDNVSSTSNRLASVDLAYHTTWGTYARLLVYKPEAGSEVVSTIGIYYPYSGAPYTIAPSTRATPNDNEIVTVDYLKGANSGVVHTTGNETIGGFKTFTNDVLVQHASCNIVLSDSGYTIGTNPVAVRYHSALVFADGTATASNTNDDNRIVQIRPGTDASGNRFLDFDLFGSTDGEPSVDLARLALHYGADGAKYATAPSTRAIPIDTEIITYDFLQTYVANNASKTSYLPLYFTADTTELHSFVPAGVTQVRYSAIEADGAGTSGLTIKMARDIGSTSSMNVTGSNANCSGYANHSVMFSVSGISNQTEIAVMVEFN